MVNLVEDDQKAGIHMDEDFGTALNNFILCCQMFFFAVGHMCAFPAEEFERTAIPRHRAGRLDKTSATSHQSVRTVLLGFGNFMSQN